MKKRTPLMQAVLTADETHVRNLLEKKSDVHLKDLNGKTAIALAFELLNFETAASLIKILIEAKADVNQTNHQGFTLLMISVLYNQFSLAALLMQYGADVNIRTYTDKHSALHFACRLRPFKWETKFNIIKSLLLAGADEEDCLEYEEDQIKNATKVLIESETEQTLMVKEVLINAVSIPLACNLIIMTYISPFIKLHPEFATIAPIESGRDFKPIPGRLSKNGFLATTPTAKFVRVRHDMTLTS